MVLSVALPNVDTSVKISTATAVIWSCEIEAFVLQLYGSGPPFYESGYGYTKICVL